MANVLKHPTSQRVWDEKKVRQRVLVLLEKIRAQEIENPPDHAGGGVPAEVGLMWLLERIGEGNFYGTVSICIKGSSMQKPRLTDVSLRFHTELSDYLL